MKAKLAWYYATDAPVEDMDAEDIAYHRNYDGWFTFAPALCWPRCKAITKGGLRCWRSGRDRGRCGFHDRKAAA